LCPCELRLRGAVQMPGLDPAILSDTIVGNQSTQLCGENLVGQCVIRLAQCYHRDVVQRRRHRRRRHVDWDGWRGWHVDCDLLLLLLLFMLLLLDMQLEVLLLPLQLLLDLVLDLELLLLLLQLLLLLDLGLDLELLLLLLPLQLLLDLVLALFIIKPTAKRRRRFNRAQIAGHVVAHHS